MRGLVAAVVTILMFSAQAYAGVAYVTETEDEIIVEYTGTAEEKPAVSEAKVPPPPPNVKTPPPEPRTIKPEAPAAEAAQKRQEPKTTREIRRSRGSVGTATPQGNY